MIEEMDGKWLDCWCFYVWGKRAHRNPRNLFILNLGVSGVLTTALCLPPTLLTCLHTGQWGLGVAACKIVPALQGQGSHTTIICINIAYIISECLCLAQIFSLKKNIF